MQINISAMKKIRYFLLVFLVCPVILFSQSKQDAIKWFSDNFMLVLEYPSSIYSNVKLERVDECEIVISYRSDGQAARMTFVTKLISIDRQYGLLGSDGIYAGILIHKDGQLDPRSARSFAIKKAWITTVEQKLRELSGFCKNDQDTWNTNAEALAWLESKLIKYAYSINKYEDYYVRSPKLERITGCSMTFSYLLFESSGDGWGPSNAVGRLTEIIPMNMDRLSDMDDCFQNDSPKISRTDNIEKKLAKNNLSILQIASAEEHLHKRILKAMQFLQQKCSTASLDLNSFTTDQEAMAITH